MSGTYDLLIIYSDRTRKVIHNVDTYDVDRDNILFYYIKNGYRSFVPITQVRFFGRLSDYGNEEGTE